MPRRDTNQIPLSTRMENEIRKLKLSATYGAVMTSSGKLPGSIESKWLSRIEEVEKQCTGSRRISVASYLGFPTYVSEHRLYQSELPIVAALLGAIEGQGRHQRIGTVDCCSVARNDGGAGGTPT